MISSLPFDYLTDTDFSSTAARISSLIVTDSTATWLSTMHFVNTLSLTYSGSKRNYHRESVTAELTLNTNVQGGTQTITQGSHIKISMSEQDCPIRALPSPVRSVFDTTGRVPGSFLLDSSIGVDDNAYTDSSYGSRYLIQQQFDATPTVGFSSFTGQQVKLQTSVQVKMPRTHFRTTNDTFALSHVSLAPIGAKMRYYTFLKDIPNALVYPNTTVGSYTINGFTSDYLFHILN